MKNLILIESRASYQEGIIKEIKNNESLNFDNIIITKNAYQAMIILNKKIYKKGNNYIFLNINEEFMKNSDEIFEKYKSMDFVVLPYIYVYTSLQVNSLPDYLFTKYIQIICFQNSYKKIAQKLVQCAISKINVKNKVLKTNVRKEYYIDEVISIIDKNYTLASYECMFNTCLTCISDPIKMGGSYNKIYQEVGEKIGKNKEYVNRNIRRLILKGFKIEQNIINFCEYQNLDKNNFKPTNANVINTIVVGYQKYIINLDEK